MMLARGLSVVVLVLLTACEQDRGAIEIRPGGPIGSDTQEIQGGSLDTTSSNVVAIVFDVPPTTANPQGGVAICSGSLIAPNLVLTAHHCVAESNTTSCSGSGFGTTFPAANFRVTTSGSAAASTLSQGVFPNVNNSTWFGVNAVMLPTTPANNICGGDMALLRLSTNITSICPLIPRVDVPVALNEAYTAVGFGITSPTGQTSGTRYTVSGLSVLCENNCGAGTNGTLEWVGGSTQQKGVCEGDSGGPALDSARRVVGTVSRGDASSCNQALYESVYGQAAWIKSVAAAAATAGGYPAADWVSGASTTYNACTGIDGGAGGGTGGGTGGGAGGGGGTTSTCNAGTECLDGSGQGDFACVTSAGGIPSNAPSCSQTVACPGGFSCWQTGTTTFACLQDCVGTGTGGGGGTTGGGGGTTGGGAGGGSGGSCTTAATSCVDASGAGNYACVDVNSSTGVPAGAPSCSQTVACPSNFSCWGSTSGNFCLENCTPGATGGGAGGGGGTTGGGGGTTGGGAGGGGVGGGVGGGFGGGTAVGGGTGGAGGGSATGGGPGTGGGDTGTGGAGGAGAGTGAGTGFNFPGLPPAPKPTGCGCSGLPEGGSALWAMFAGLMLLRRRRRS